MDADHSSICKFKTENDPNYKQVISALSHLVQDALQITKRRPLVKYLNLTDESNDAQNVVPKLSACK